MDFENMRQNLQFKIELDDNAASIPHLIMLWCILLGKRSKQFNECRKIILRLIKFFYFYLKMRFL